MDRILLLSLFTQDNEADGGDDDGGGEGGGARRSARGGTLTDCNEQSCPCAVSADCTSSITISMTTTNRYVYAIL